MTCPICHDRGAIPDRRLHAGRYVECPHCDPLTDPVEEYRGVVGFLAASAITSMTVLLVCAFTDADELAIGIIRGWLGW